MALTTKFINFNYTPSTMNEILVPDNPSLSAGRIFNESISSCGSFYNDRCAIRLASTFISLAGMTSADLNPSSLCAAGQTHSIFSKGANNATYSYCRSGTPYSSGISSVLYVVPAGRQAKVIPRTINVDYGFTVLNHTFEHFEACTSTRASGTTWEVCQCRSPAGEWMFEASTGVTGSTAFQAAFNLVHGTASHNYGYGGMCGGAASQSWTISPGVHSTKLNWLATESDRNCWEFARYGSTESMDEACRGLAQSSRCFSGGAWAGATNDLVCDACFMCGQHAGPDTYHAKELGGRYNASINYARRGDVCLCVSACGGGINHEGPGEMGGILLGQQAIPVNFSGFVCQTRIDGSFYANTITTLGRSTPCGSWLWGANQLTGFEVPQGISYGADNPCAAWTSLGVVKLKCIGTAGHVNGNYGSASHYTTRVPSGMLCGQCVPGGGGVRIPDSFHLGPGESIAIEACINIQCNIMSFTGESVHVHTCHCATCEGASIYPGGDSALHTNAWIRELIWRQCAKNNICLSYVVIEEEVS